MSCTLPIPKTHKTYKRTLEKRYVNTTSTSLCPSADKMHYELDSVIGSGAFGTVYTVKHDQGLVIKKIDRSGIDSATKKAFTTDLAHFREATNREIELNLILAQTSAVVKLVDMFETEENVWLVFERMQNTLHSLVVSAVPTYDPVQVCYSMIKCISIMHEMGVAHRDLKPQNILISAAATAAASGAGAAAALEQLVYDIRICDLGMAKISKSNSSSPNTSNSTSSSSSPTSVDDVDAVIHTDYVTTRWYRAPELICGYAEHNLFALDMWSIGCIMVEIFTGCVLFPGHNTVEQVQLIGGCLALGPKAENLKIANFLRAQPNTSGIQIMCNAALLSVREASVRKGVCCDCVGGSSSNSSSSCISSCINININKPRPVQTQFQKKLSQSVELLMCLPPKVFDLVTKLLTYDPDIRFTAANALNHPLFIGSPYPDI